MADANSTPAQAPDATVEPKCCGNCRWMSGSSYSGWGRCDMPLPEYLTSAGPLPDNRVHETYDGTNCDAWQQREAE